MRLPKARLLVEEQLSDLPASVKLVVAHPEFRARYLVVGAAVEAGAVYVRLVGSGLDADALHDQVSVMLQALSQTGTRRASKVEIVIDEADRAVPEALPVYLKRLLSMRGVNRVYLVSQLLPLSVVADSTLIPIMQIVPTNEAAHLLDYVRKAEGVHSLEVRTFGRGRVQIDGRVITEWGGVLPRTLFAYMVDRGMVTRKEIFETFWRDLSNAEATNVFHVTKRKISEVLDTVLTQFGGGFYHLSTDLHIAYDVNMFNECFNLCQITQGAESIEALERGIDLYRGEFLAGVEMPWVVERREVLRNLYSEMLVLLARRYHEQGDLVRAYATYLRAAAHNHLREDLVQAILGLARELNSYSDGIRAYNRLLEALRRQMDIEPSAQTRALYELLRGEAGAA